MLFLKRVGLLPLASFLERFVQRLGIEEQAAGLLLAPACTENGTHNGISYGTEHELLMASADRHSGILDHGCSARPGTSFGAASPKA